MKKTLLLTLSLVLNVGLILHAARPRGLKQGLPVADSTMSSPTPSSGAAPSVATIPTIVTNAFHWSVIESTNYATYRDNLRAIGCAEESIRDLIEADLRATLAANEPDGTTRDYWKNNRLAGRLRLARMRQREAAVRSNLAALGLPTNSLTLQDGADHNDIEFLPAAKQARLAALNEDFQRMTDERDIQSGGRYTKADLDYLQRLEEQRESAIRATLTPEEYFEHQLRNSPLAQRLRDVTTGFEPTEAEFRKIFSIESQAEAMTQVGQEDVFNQWRVEQIETALGSDRGAAFLKSQNPIFHDTHSLATRLSLPEDAADAIYRTRLETDSQLAQLNDGEWTVEQKSEAISLIVQNARDSLKVELKEKFDLFVAEAGNWLLPLITDQRDFAPQSPEFPPSKP